MSNGPATFDVLVRLCQTLRETPAHTKKTEEIRAALDGCGDPADRVLLCKLLTVKGLEKTHNVGARKLIKKLAALSGRSEKTLMEEYKATGDVAKMYASMDPDVRRADAPTLAEVWGFLMNYTADEFLEAVVACGQPSYAETAVRLLLKDLSIGAGSKIVLDAVGPDVYDDFYRRHDLDGVLCRHYGVGDTFFKTTSTPLAPMLASPCKDLEKALNKWRGRAVSEPKIDGERVQVHCHGTAGAPGSSFSFYSRSLKPIPEHKVKHLIPELTEGVMSYDYILDGELVLIDDDGKMLPFGTLGVHKKGNLLSTLMVFDLIMERGRSFLETPWEQRRQSLEMISQRMSPRPGVFMRHLKLVPTTRVEDAAHLRSLLAECVREDGEGLVLKSTEGAYEPGKRRWLKVKKDYLYEGRLADSVDLSVLGAWNGTGKMGGMLSVFLMGMRDGDRWRAVTKVHTGFTAEAMERVGRELKPLLVPCDATPPWLVSKKTPQFAAADPRAMPVWEVAASQFTTTADGEASLRFPRIVRERPDKDWSTATTYDELGKMRAESKERCVAELAPRARAKRVGSNKRRAVEECCLE